MIIQGSNEPVIINLPEVMTGATSIEVLLYNRERVIKRWSKADMTIIEKQLICPLKEAETLRFPAGSATLEVKWLDENGNIKHSEKKTLAIETREDKKPLEV